MYSGAVFRKREKMRELDLKVLEIKEKLDEILEINATEKTLNAEFDSIVILNKGEAEAFIKSDALNVFDGKPVQVQIKVIE